MGQFCRVTKDSVGGHAGQLLQVRDWQAKLVDSLLATDASGKLLHRRALIGLARKNGKSSLGAALALWALVMGGEGAEVYSAAGDKEQARIVFGTAKRMVELDPELSQLLRVYRDVIEYQDTGSIYRAVSSEAYTKEGLNPSFVVFDEVHVQPDPELWQVFSLASGARPEPLMVGITTAGVRTDRFGRDTIAYQLYQYGQRVAAGEVIDPTFYFCWYEPSDPTGDHKDPGTWGEANPGLGDIVALADFASALAITPEAEFRTKRCNQWVASSETWLPTGAWDDCKDSERGPIADGASVVLGFDGSFNNDSTALVVSTVEPKPHLDVAKVWERPIMAAHSWRVPVIEVEQAIRDAAERWNVLAIAADPHLWQPTLEALLDDGLPVEHFTQSASRMVPATQRFYELVTAGGLTHSGNEAMARHIANAYTSYTRAGVQLTKERKGSNRKIDLAVAAVMAVDTASAYARAPEQITGNYVTSLNRRYAVNWGAGPRSRATRRVSHPIPQWARSRRR